MLKTSIYHIELPWNRLPIHFLNIIKGNILILLIDIVRGGVQSSNCGERLKMNESSSCSFFGNVVEGVVAALVVVGKGGIV